MEIKRINQLPVADALAENTNVLIEADGSTQRIPADKIVPKGMVKTVNNTAPDENGNVNIATDSTLTQSGQAADAAAVGEKVSKLSEEIAEQSWDSIGSDNILIEWDGDTEGRTCVMDRLYKVSDAPIPIDLILSGNASCHLVLPSGEERYVDMTNTDLYIANDSAGWACGEVYVLCAYADNVTIGGATVPEVGIYFMAYGGGYTSKLEYEVITPIPEKYLPEGVGGSGGVFVVTVTYDSSSGTASCDKTAHEIYDAVSAGTPLFARYFHTGSIYGLTFDWCNASDTDAFVYFHTTKFEENGDATGNVIEVHNDIVSISSSYRHEHAESMPG